MSGTITISEKYIRKYDEQSDRRFGAAQVGGISGMTAEQQAKLDTAYDERFQWDGGATNLDAATGRASLNAAAASHSHNYDNYQSWTIQADLGNPDTSLNVVSGKVIHFTGVGNLSTYVWETGGIIEVQIEGAGYLIGTNNLSDISSASTARTNLGLGTAATRADTFFGQIAGTNNWTGLNRFSQGDIRFELDASNYIDLVADASNIYFRPVKADVADLTRALRYRYGDNIWEFRGSLMIDDATTGTHAVNRNTGDARYGQLTAANEWTQAQTWKITGNSYIDNAYWSGNGMYLRGYDDQATPVQAYILRTYASSGIQLELEKGGITANGNIIATGTVRAYG